MQAAMHVPNDVEGTLGAAESHFLGQPAIQILAPTKERLSVDGRDRIWHRFPV
jgi:hypothetical protein